MFSSCLQDDLHWVSGHLVTKPSRHQEICMLLTRGARKPNLQECVLVRTQFDHVCFDHLSRKTYAKHSIAAKAFGPLIVVAHTPLTFGYF